VKNYDLEFMKRFSALIVGMMVFTVVLILFALFLHGQRPTEPNPDQVARLEARIAPVGGVYAGETGRAAMLEAQEAARAAAVSQVAYGGTLDGGDIYGRLCGACHNSGAGGAPMMNRAAWTPRIEQGFETLVRHSIDGFQGDAGIMPPRGGNPALTDEQIEVAVRWMIDNLD
jgi:cytochrome c5